jgi:hypothetical protein
MDDTASRRLEAGPQIVDIVGIARQHDQIARRQQVEIGAAAQLNRSDQPGRGEHVLGRQRGREGGLPHTVQLDRGAAPLAARIQMAAAQGE